MKISSPNFSLNKNEKHSCYIKLLHDLKSNNFTESSYEFSDKLDLISNDTNFPIAVKYKIQKPIMQLSTKVIEFSKTLDLTSNTSDLPKASLTIKSIGTADLKGNITLSTWLTSSHETFSLSPGESIQIDLSLERTTPVNSNSLLNESYAVNVISNAGTEKILCKYNVMSPQHSQYFLNLAKDQISKKQFKEALNNLNTVEKLEPNKSLTNEIFGDCYHIAAENINPIGDFEQAIKYYSKSIELDPKNSNLIHKRGKSYNRKSDHELAITDFNKALQLNPNFGEVLFDRGVIYKKLNKNDFAFKDFSGARKISPSNQKYINFYRNVIYHKIIEPMWIAPLITGLLGVVLGFILLGIGSSVSQNTIWTIQSIISGVIQGLIIGLGIIIFTDKKKLILLKLILPILFTVGLNGGWPGAGFYFYNNFFYIPIFNNFHCCF